MIKPVLCIYHANCADGFGAAWVVRRKFPDAEFFAAVHNKPPPDFADRDVVMVDFAYKPPIMEQIAKKAASFIWIDHHISAIEENKVAGLFANGLRDINRSGAMLAWDYFFPDEQPPAAIAYIQDRDLWKFIYVETKSFMAYLFSLPYDFEAWDRAIKNASTELLKSMLDEGIGILRKQAKDVNELIAVGKHRIKIDGHDVPALNCPYFFSSEAGTIMCKGEPFAACWYIADGRTNFSLRSNDDGVDVSVIAQKYGGGGHRNAAGFSIDFGTIDI